MKRRVIRETPSMLQFPKFFHVVNGVKVRYSMTVKGSHARGKRGARFEAPDGWVLKLITDSREIDDAYHAEVKQRIEEVWTAYTPPPAIRFGTELNDALDMAYFRNIAARTPAEARFQQLFPATIEGYLKSLSVFLDTLENPLPVGPEDVTVDVANLFSQRYAACARGTPVSLRRHIRTMQAFWKHLLALGIVTSNPWLSAQRYQTALFMKAAAEATENKAITNDSAISVSPVMTCAAVNRLYDSSAPI